MLTLPTSPAPHLALPPGPGPEVQAAGVHWDAVKVRGYLGDRVLAALDEHCGAVIRDPHARLVYFLIRPGAAEGLSSPGFRGE